MQASFVKEERIRVVIAESQRRIKRSAYWIPVFSGLNPRFHTCDHDKQTLRY